MQCNFISASLFYNVTSKYYIKIFIKQALYTNFSNKIVMCIFLWPESDTVLYHNANFMHLICYYFLKGHWTTSASCPHFFSKKVFFFCFFYTIISVYLCTDFIWLILLATSTHLQRYMKPGCEVFLLVANFQSCLLKMAATVMTIEYGTIHHYYSLEQISGACLCSSLDRYKN